jgi:hypothetical protein
MRCLNHKLFVPVIIVLSYAAVRAQQPDYRIGRTATQEEIQAWDISIGPEGKELPEGHGTAKEGAVIFAQKCAFCHGSTGEGYITSRLAGGQGSFVTDDPVITPGSMWPYATTIWDFIHRAMPEYPFGPMPVKKEGEVPGFRDLKPMFNVGRPLWIMQDGDLLKTGVNPNLTVDQIYALTAFILYRNNTIKEDTVMDRESLPKIKMPNRNGFIPVGPDGKVPVWKSRDPKVRIEPHVSPNSKPLLPNSQPVNVTF